jgi:hypothetical protein
MKAHGFPVYSSPSYMVVSSRSVERCALARTIVQPARRLVLPAMGLNDHTLPSDVGFSFAGNVHGFFGSQLGVTDKR